MQRLLELVKVDKRFGKYAALTNISWRVHQGECVAITGGNGAGKSTMLHIIAGLIRPSAGTRIQHMDQLRIGYVPERFPVSSFRPTEYLHHVAGIQRIGKTEAARRIDAMMTVFQLTDTKMTLCSKGMLQKVNLMQALLRQPDLLILDEPLSGLDDSSQIEMAGILNETKRQGTSIVMSVHEPLLISSVADRVTRLRQGRIVQDGLLDGNIREASMRVEFMLGEANVLAELEKVPGFLHWESKGSTSVMMVVRSLADEMMLNILQSGGSILHVEQWNERGGAPVELTKQETKGAPAS